MVLGKASASAVALDTCAFVVVLGTSASAVEVAAPAAEPVTDYFVAACDT